jgi:hypothetical protein
MAWVGYDFGVVLMEDIERIPYRDDLPKATFDVLSLGSIPLVVGKA